MAAPSYGAANLQWVGIATETTYGTPQATPSLFVPCDTPVWTNNTENLVDTALRGSMSGEFQQVKGLRNDQVTFKTNLYLGSVFAFLRSVLGLPDVLTGSSDPWTHKTSVQSGNNGQPAGTTVFFYDAQGKAWQMGGAMCSEVKVTINTGGLATLEVTYIGLPAAAITPPTNTPTTDVPAPSWNSTITIGGVAQLKYSQVTFDIKRDVKPIPTLTGTQAPFAIFAGAVTVSGTLDGVYTGSTDIDLVANLTNVQPVLVVKIAPVGDAVHYVQFQCSKVAYDDTKVAGTTDWMTVNGTIKALANPTDVAGGGNQSPMLVTLLSAVSTAI